MYYEDSPVLPAVAVFAAILLFYRATTYTMQRSRRFNDWVEGKPETLIRDGLYEVDSFQRLNITDDEFFMELRQQGVEHLGQVRLGILEVDGNISLFFFQPNEVKPGLSVLPAAMASAITRVNIPMTNNSSRARKCCWTSCSGALRANTSAATVPNDYTINTETLNVDLIMIIANQKASYESYPSDLQQIMNIETAEESRAWLANWDQIRPTATPLYAMPDLAVRLGVGKIFIKDESVRSPLGSFKALGAPIALIRLILRKWPTEDIDPGALIAGKYATRLKTFTVISATDGNHGRALAAAAESIGCACVIVLHANVSMEREAVIAAHGAKIVRIRGNYDESVKEAARLAQVNGWQVVADTSYDDYEAIPRAVMQGYGTITAEALEQMQASTDDECPYTHVFLQGGVGGLAAGVISYFWERYGSKRPKFIIVEPQQADCLYQSARLGHVAKATGSVDSIMAGLACGEPSPIAWKFLQNSVDFFMTITDDDAVAAMQLLAAGSRRDAPVVVGESGAAGFAGLAHLLEEPSLAHTVGLGEQSSILLINTEGATAPRTYEKLVGERFQSVLARQARWLSERAATPDASS